MIALSKHDVDRAISKVDRELSKHDVDRGANIGLPRLKHWGERGLVSRPYTVAKTLALDVGCYLADRGVAIDIVRVPVGLVAGKSENELRAHFYARGETRLTIDFDTKECVIETPSAVARRFAAADLDHARIISLPLRKHYEDVLNRLAVR